tara:strand:- start:113 stop:325 length:213 start_codon:yes stop_codon:yes gene_type:complete
MALLIGATIGNLVSGTAYASNAGFVSSSASDTLLWHTMVDRRNALPNAAYVGNSTFKEVLPIRKNNKGVP